jgi:hypothetical protein
VIRDNDGDYQSNCINAYSDYQADYIKIFYDADDGNSTFEICLYNLNQASCDDLWLEGRKTLPVQDFMLKNKADCAFTLLEEKAGELITPDYIKQAFTWIKE